MSDLRRREPVSSAAPTARRRPAAMLLLSVLLIVAGVVSIERTQHLAVERQLMQDQVGQLDLAEIRLQLGWLNFDLLHDVLLADAGNRSLDDDRFDEYSAARQDLLDRASAMVDLGGETGPLASSLVADQADVPASWPPTAVELDQMHFALLTETEVGSVVRRMPSHADAVLVSVLSDLVLRDALIIELGRQAADGDDPSRQSGDASALVDFRQAPGWMGLDREAPLAANHLPFRPPGGDFASLPRVNAAAQEALSALQPIWDYDRWIDTGSADVTTPPPLELSELYDEVRAADGHVRPAVLASFDDEAQTIIAAGPDWRAVQLWLLLGVVSMVAAAVLFIWAGAILWRRHRDLSTEANVDNLTGAFNRRFLETEVTDRCGRRYQHHLVVMADLDRFKLVNDTWGHAVGDAILVAAAQRLEAAASDLVAQREGSAHAVVRLGGDEFVVALHTPAPLDVGDVEAAFRSASGPTEAGAGEPVPLEMSFGLAMSAGPAILGDLLHAADLAAYEDKRRRRRTPSFDDTHQKPDVVLH